MIITRRTQYLSAIIAGFLGLIGYFGVQFIFHIEINNHGLFWPIFIMWVYWMWKSSPAYTNYEFKIEHLPIDPTGEKHLLLYTGIGATWEIFCSGIDPERGICFTINQVQTSSFFTGGQITKVKRGNYYLLPSPSDAVLEHLSGHLEILVADAKGVRKERFIEKVKRDSFGLVLHFGGQGKDGQSLVMFETIKKKPSWQDAFTNPFKMIKE